jgi:NAD(P)H dehydrogenase (quinone)
VSKILKISCKIKAALLVDNRAASRVRYQEMGETPNRSGTLLLLAHPNERSLNHAIAGTAAEAVRAAGVELLYHDLYAEGFGAVLSKEETLRRFSFDEAVQGYADELRRARLLVIVHPDWWGQPPAILKGWLDRVFRPGVAYDFRGEEFMDKHRIPLLTGMRALVFATSDAPKPATETPLERVWRENVFEFCGIAPSEITVFHGVHEASRRARKQWLDSVATAVARYAAPGYETTEDNGAHW